MTIPISASASEIEPLKIEGEARSSITNVMHATDAL
jgi:hypothetical protein